MIFQVFHDYAKHILRYFTCIPQRLVTLYDPTNPVLRPKLVQCKARHKIVSYNLRSNECDSIDSTDNIVSIEFLAYGMLSKFAH